jgi:hypothetical protein
VVGVPWQPNARQSLPTGSNLLALCFQDRQLGGSKPARNCWENAQPTRKVIIIIIIIIIIS